MLLQILLISRYEIMNFQKLSNGSYGYMRVGTWDNGKLAMQSGLVIFNSHDKIPPVSVCSHPCPPGEAKVRYLALEYFSKLHTFRF